MLQTLTHPLSNATLGASATPGSPAPLTSATIAQQPQVTPGQSARALTVTTQHGPIGRLPLEVLDEIIVLTVTDETANYAFFHGGVYAHRRLALVCPLWRNIVVAMRKRPWTYSNINLGRDCADLAVSDDEKASMMREYISFSDNEPLSVTLDLDLASGGIPPTYVCAVLEQSHRLRSLSILGDLRDGGAKFTLSLISHQGGLPILQTLSLEHVSATPVEEDTDEVTFDFFDHASALTNLTIIGSVGRSLIDVWLPHDRIAAFTCKDMDAEELLDFLRVMPNLEGLDFAGPAAVVSPAETFHSAEVGGNGNDAGEARCDLCGLWLDLDEEDGGTALELPLLRQLTIRDTAEAVYSGILEYLFLPAIEEVTLKSDEVFEAEVMVALQSDIYFGGGDVERLVVNYL